MCADAAGFRIRARPRLWRVRRSVARARRSERMRVPVTGGGCRAGRVPGAPELLQIRRGRCRRVVCGLDVQEFGHGPTAAGGATPHPKPPRRHPKAPLGTTEPPGAPELLQIRRGRCRRVVCGFDVQEFGHGPTAAGGPTPPARISNAPPQSPTPQSPTPRPNPQRPAPIPTPRPNPQRPAPIPNANAPIPNAQIPNAPPQSPPVPPESSPPSPEARATTRILIGADAAGADARG
ncbi:hypothetical protein QE377_000813 [Microbacterium sp. SORGH_AS 862]|nr:hypothetical protein [Microbacterium sp. SORGH_AS_0862]